MLWKKESKKKDAFYVDMIAIAGTTVQEKLFNRNPLPYLLHKCNKREKNDKKSRLMRQEGNELYSSGDVLSALRLYNQSLCLAPEGSENIGSTYARRSACFFRIKMFENCLKDIELAEEFGYPKKLISKLDQLKAECSRHFMRGDNYEKLETKLDFEADEKFPSMANVLRIVRDEDGNYSTVAKENIGIGKVVVMEKAFVNDLLTICPELNCSHCLKGHTNLMPCNKCTNAMFCSDECQASVFHQSECGKNIFYESSFNSYVNSISMMTFKSVLLAINSFSNVNKLIKFVEQIINSGSNVLPPHLTDALSQYEAFLKQSVNFSTDKITDIIEVINFIYKNILEIPKVSASFNTEKNRRFLMHLIGHHYYVFQCNKNYQYFHKCLMYQYFNYSCAPNVVRVPCEGNEVYVTVRPIEKGAQLYLAYTSAVLLQTESKLKRQRIIWNEKNMICLCIRCTDGEEVTLLPMERHRLFLDPNYQYILSHYSYEFEFNDSEVQKMKEKCMSFLEKYRKITWCHEIAFVLEAYIRIVYAQFSKSDVLF